MNLKDLKWPQVVLISVIVVTTLTAVTVLNWIGADTAALLAFGSAILIGLGVMAGQQSGIRDNVNGNTSRMLEILERQSDMLARMQPPSESSSSRDQRQSDDGT